MTRLGRRLLQGAKQEPRIALIIMTIMVGLGLEFSTLDQQGPETHSVRLHLAQNMRTMVPPRAQRDAGQLALSTLKHLGRIDRRPGNFDLLHHDPGTTPTPSPESSEVENEMRSCHHLGGPNRPAIRMHTDDSQALPDGASARGSNRVLNIPNIWA